jgi:hypothetical protein
MLERNLKRGSRGTEETMTRRLKIATSVTLIAAVLAALGGTSGEETLRADETPIAASAGTESCPSPRYQHNRRVYLKMNERAEELRREVNRARPARARVAALKRVLASLAGELC